MKERIEKIKTHFRENKDRYITAVVTAAGTVVLVLLYEHNRESSEVHNDFKSLVHVGNNNVNTIVIKKPGNSGDILMDAKNGELYYSKGHASRELEISRQDVKNLIEKGALQKVQDGNISKLEIS
jgi:hypothetical protein